MEISNLDLTGITVTDELYTDFGTSSSALTGWPIFKASGFAIYEDATPHAGSPLVLDTDYTFDNKDIRKSQELGEDVYTKITMLTHTTGDIYISYTAIGSYIDADDIRNVLDNFVVARPATLDISAGNQETDLSVYETGGASAKQSGFKIQVSWTGGTGAYFHLWTGTGYTIGGLAIADFICAGTGNVVLELDNDNSDWIVWQDNRELIYAAYKTVASTVGATTIVNYGTKVKDNYATVTTGTSWKFTCPKDNTLLDITAIYQTNGASNNMLMYKGGSADADIPIGSFMASSGGVQSSTWCIILDKNDYIDIRGSVGVLASANSIIYIRERRP